MKDKDKKEGVNFEEIKRLAEEADNNKSFDLGFEEDLDENIYDIDFTDDQQNPKESHRLFYAIQGILKNHLPKGDSYDELRKVVREEKTIFLTGKKIDNSGRRNADSRQAYISTHLKIALNTLFEWISEGGNSFDLFMKFRALNIERGYFEEDELSDYNQKLKKGLKGNSKDHQ
ncbi:hypothetical protein P700755_001723 [Psychroflexus torquis ATCC 700755]|uniref:Uncharacterized protein n=1 Tax=Psychroflexus torquis (strain ATCC 700755 / CIP 106069 / ACAM 623) TaxID=313595 RepID=K4IDD4_PSYTT|nr:hypothetical protein [Psychroflexus torquis]AFU68577.1 hypothetical protein P700755_001723 [Psychroflexus torquis ATCC 700755]